MWTAREALRTRAFGFIAVSTLLSEASSSALGFNMVSYLREQAYLSTALAAGVLSVGRILEFASLAWGYTADRFTTRWGMIASMLGARGLAFAMLVNRPMDQSLEH